MSGRMRWSRRGLALPALLLALLWPRPAAAVTEIQFWHALDGPNGGLVTRIAEAFNASQTRYRVVPVYKGTYAETISSGITAYRTGVRRTCCRSSRSATARWRRRSAR